MQAKPPTVVRVRIENNCFKTRLRAVGSGHGGATEQVAKDADGDIFRICEVEPYEYGIRTIHVTSVRADTNKTIVNHAPQLITWEKWKIEKQANGLYTFKSFHNTYLTFSKDKKSVILMDSVTPEAFFAIHIID